MHQQQFVTKFDHIKSAMLWCTEMARIAQPMAVSKGGGSGSKVSTACIVLDIDKTIVKGNGKPIRDVIAFARYVTLVLRYPLYLVTARPDYPHNRTWTVNQLRSLGFQLMRGKPSSSSKGSGGKSTLPIPYQHLYMMPLKDYSKSMAGNSSAFSDYKWRCRTAGIKERVLINVGDQWDDLVQRPPRTPPQSELYNHMYQIERTVLRGTRGKGVVVGINVSPCSLISVKLPA